MIFRFVLINRENLLDLEQQLVLQNDPKTVTARKKKLQGNQKRRNAKNGARKVSTLLSIIQISFFQKGKSFHTLKVRTK